MIKFNCLIVFTSSDNMRIVIVCYAVCDVINFEIYLRFIVNPFMTEAIII